MGITRGHGVLTTWTTDDVDGGSAVHLPTPCRLSALSFQRPVGWCRTDENTLLRQGWKLQATCYWRHGILSAVDLGGGKSCPGYLRLRRTSYWNVGSPACRLFALFFDLAATSFFSSATASSRVATVDLFIASDTCVISLVWYRNTQV